MRRLSASIFLASLASSRAAAAADDVADFVGVSESALPAVGRVAVASPRKPLVVTAAAGAGYGYTEAQPGERGAHHRGIGTLAVGVQPLHFLAVSLLLDGQIEHSPKDVLGAHTTVNAAPVLAVRAAEAVAKGVALGVELDARVPGANLPSFQPGSGTYDVKALATYAAGAQQGTLNVGYRVDRSSELVDDPLRLRRGDRIALEASQFDALLLGVGGSKRLGNVEVFGALTWNVLLGTRAPKAIESPLLLGLGGRIRATELLEAELRAEIELGQRPGTETFDPIAPVPPRLAIIAGLRFAKGPPKPVASAAPAPVDTAPPPVVVAPTTQTVTGVVLGDDGAPVANAEVSIAGATARTAADGSFAIPNVPLGKQSVSVKASGFEDRTIDVTGGAARVTVKHAIKPGQLRGLVRAFSGKAIAAASIRVEPLGIEAKTDADGVFTIDVPPGAYEVVVTAPGFAQQRRKMQVEQNGVTILNADLRQGP